MATLGGCVVVARTGKKSRTTTQKLFQIHTLLHSRVTLLPSPLSLLFTSFLLFSSFSSVPPIQNERFTLACAAFSIDRSGGFIELTTWGFDRTPALSASESCKRNGCCF